MKFNATKRIEEIERRLDAIEKTIADDHADKGVPEKPKGRTYYCSFCGKSQHEVRRLIAGPTVFICDECVMMCVGICIEENIAPDFAPAPRKGRAA